MGPVETPTRNLPFAAMFNFRDLGGYTGLGGRTVRWRRVFRSDSLHAIDDADREAFTALGIRTVIDLRRGGEVQRVGRVHEYEGLVYRHHEIDHLDWEQVPFPEGMTLDRWLADRYLNFASQGAAGIAASLAALADPAGTPAVVHCMAGKDRTGVVCGLTLSLLGVADADVADDYALSMASMAALTAHLRTQHPAEHADDKPHFFDCPADAMAMFLADLRAEHGSIEQYVRRIGLNDGQVATLRDHLLE